ncbi:MULTISPECIES: hypothetical protein [unclassified Fibrobacter]|uniref:hypothetical protein n=1 Tax=unclassified Fibrobacter TaxID=2634177 RepID=UPI0009332FC6|nr:MULTISPECIES: hypothetical protein [unclassified Fibrobacter]OWV02662.1 hypothetical protein B7993_14880 [Fibrobacter sp. UWH3]
MNHGINIIKDFDSKVSKTFFGRPGAESAVTLYFMGLLHSPHKTEPPRLPHTSNAKKADESPPQGATIVAAMREENATTWKMNSLREKTHPLHRQKVLCIF